MFQALRILLVLFTGHQYIYSYSVDGKFNEWGNITLELHSTLPDDSIIDKIAFGSLYIDEKYVFHRKGYEDSDNYLFVDGDLPY